MSIIKDLNDIVVRNLFKLTGTVISAKDGFTIDANTGEKTPVYVDQTTGQTIGSDGARLTKLWATDITCANAINGSVTGNAGTVSNATLTTALTVNTGTLTLTADAANNSVVTVGAGAVGISGSNTGDNAANSSSTYIGTTSIALNRASAAQSLTGITSIDGNAATVTTNANLTGVVTSVGNATSIASGAIKGNMLQSAAADMGAADVTINLGNTNGSYVTNLTTDGTITATTGFTGNVSGSAATLTTTRTIFGQNFNGSANVTGTATISTIGLRSNSPDSSFGIYADTSLSDPVHSSSSIRSIISPTYTGAESVTEGYINSLNGVYVIVNAGHTNTGAMTGTSSIVRRNNNGVAADDNGTLSEISGLSSNYGHAAINAAATPLTTNVYGVKLTPNYATGTITNLYDIFIDTGTTGGTVTNSWSYYQTNTRKNYFGGSLGLGVTVPTAVLHVKAGTATAGTAPVKLTTGTLNTTAEAGAVEYNNTFWVTNSDATRRGLVTAVTATKTTAGAPFTNDGYITMNINGTDVKILTTA